MLTLWTNDFQQGYQDKFRRKTVFSTNGAGTNIHNQKRSWTPISNVRVKLYKTLRRKQE
jgi:hypothetical protein